jgi:protein FAM32A
MPSDDYAPIGGGGALKLKGAKVTKKKKSRKTDKSSALEKTLAGSSADGTAPVDKDKSPAAAAADDAGDRLPLPQKTEAERRHEEVRRKRVRTCEAFD